MAVFAMEQCGLRRLTVALLFSLFAFCAVGHAQSGNQLAPQSPRLLLTAQRLRRLKRDRQRQTVRWVNFENRIQGVADSPERGFELALYYSITGDEARGREAIAWALQHDDRRQMALVLDWCGPLLSDEQRKALAGRVSAPVAATTSAPSILTARDALFASLASQQPVPSYSDAQKKAFIADLEHGAFADPQQLYAACEFLMAYRMAEHADLREDAPHFFSVLPTEFLLSLKPDAAEHPGWMAHIAALALVSVDPNLQGSQFLQGWAMESRQMIRQGSGVAYELLWADPYLPGVGYQNLDPWAYDEGAGRLFARTDWTPQACWIGISDKGVQAEQCPPGWDRKLAKFGRLTLIPAASPCTELPQRKAVEFIIVWKLPPRQEVMFWDGREDHHAQSDPAGMVHLGSNVTGKVCLPREPGR